MYVRINRDVCPAHLALCERCLGQFLKFPMGYERRCFEVIEEDAGGDDVLTLEISSGGHTITLVLDKEQRELIAGEGWAHFVDFPVPIYRNVS